LFPFSVCRKLSEVAVFCQFHFPFVEFRKHGDIEMKTWRRRQNMVTYVDTEKCRHGDM
jgi:hypothetical protein